MKLSDNLSPCSRRGGALLSAASMPRKDSFGQPIRLELCPACDADKPAAGVLLRWLTSGGGKDPARAAEGARLGMEWMKEGMAAHGWGWVPKGLPTEYLPRHTGPRTLGSG
ncbi:DUF6300 family protein [Streptomyces sp. HK10]|uniref:DUF6300 family protein n=1 Tax=Streptomyces sp. HK10 TaxID=3373255 RepID=UPI0037496F3C